MVADLLPRRRAKEPEQWAVLAHRGRGKRCANMTNLVDQVFDLGLTMRFVCGSSPAVQRVNSVVAEVARTNIPILLIGESGTGKDAYSRLFHHLGTNPTRPIKRVNCPTLSLASLRERIVDCLGNGAGHDSGYGTLFLDQIDELDLHCQGLLLPLLPDEEVRNGGSEISARLISASVSDLEHQVATEKFRRDLYFRINGVSLRLPPLRERQEDIPVLFEHFLAGYAKQLQRPLPEVVDQDIEILCSHRWPGNIRELQNVAKMAVVVGRVQAAVRDLRSPAYATRDAAKTTASSSLKAAVRAASRQTERELILRALERTRWNRKRAAQALQISYKSLLSKLKQIGNAGATSGKEFSGEP